MRRHAEKKVVAPHPIRLFHPKPLAPRVPTKTDPGAFVPIDNEYDIVVAHTLTITATAACLIATIPRELVALSDSVGVGTSLDFNLDSYHVAAALEDGCDACGLRGARC